jgi:hypothetical protein
MKSYSSSSQKLESSIASIEAVLMRQFNVLSVEAVVSIATLIDPFTISERLTVIHIVGRVSVFASPTESHSIRNFRLSEPRSQKQTFRFAPLQQSKVTAHIIITRIMIKILLSATIVTL